MPPMPTKRVAERDTGAALVPLPRVTDDPEPADPRIGDVDEWGRSEHIRELARALYEPLYKYWFRAEWEGLEKIPANGGALLVANHAAAIPSDAPVIMHGIEKELGRPVYGMADHFFKGDARRRHAVGARRRRGRRPGERVPPVARAEATCARVSRRHQGPGQDLRRALPAAALRPRRLRRDRDALGRARSCRSPLWVPRSRCRSWPRTERWPRCSACPYFPLTANMLAFGPLLGGLLYFPAKFKLRVLDPVYFDVPADQERYSKSLVMDEADRIRVQIQDALYDMLRKRTSVWFG